MPTQHHPNAAMKIAVAALAVLLLAGCDPEYDEHVREQKRLELSRSIDRARAECLRNGGSFKVSVDVNLRSVLSSGSFQTECVVSPKEGK
ncbi:hypothetical protein [Candidatus Electronema sp. JM]|uniref:hypothetical protein n=1 Tax=Candidatus Electronema sp. JM TaxID=3401571 RepID=UPI003AA7D38C